MKTQETMDGRRLDPVIRHLLAGLLVVLPFADAASAEFVGIEVVQKDNECPPPEDCAFDCPNLTCNVYAVFDGTDPGDLVIAVAGIPEFPLNISVINGKFYQHEFGEDRAPNCALIPAFPCLAFDTFVTIGVKCDDGTDATSLTPGWPGFTNDSLGGDNGGEDLAWFVTPNDQQGWPDETGRVLIGQFSTRHGDGIMGTVFLSGFSGPEGDPFQEYLSFECLKDQEPPTGACCDDATGTCTDGVTEADCLAAGERYGGDASDCATIDPPCEPPTGACCLTDQTCVTHLSEADCTAQGGAFAGEGTACFCGEPIPTVSQWGLSVMTVLLLAAAALVIARRRVPAV